MIFGRSNILDSASKYLEEYITYDPFELGLYLRRKLFEYMAKRGPGNLLQDLGMITDIAKMFAFNSMISMAGLLATIMLDYGYLDQLDKRSYARLMKRILEIIERGDVESLEMQARSLSTELLPDSELYLPVGGRMLERVVVNARSKLSYVRVSVGEPLKHGLLFSERMLKNGIDTIAVRDDLKLWAIQRSNAVIIPCYATTSDGMIVTDYGVEPAVRIAWKQGVRVYIIHPWSGLVAPYTSSEVEAAGSGFRVRPFDIIDPIEGEALLVTDKFVVRLDKETLFKTIDEAKRTLSEIVSIAFSHVVEG